MGKLGPIAGYMKEKGIIAEVATSFADSEKVSLGLDMGVLQVVSDNKSGNPMMMMNLTHALKDCDTKKSS